MARFVDQFPIRRLSLPAIAMGNWMMVVFVVTFIDFLFANVTSTVVSLENFLLLLGIEESLLVKNDSDISSDVVAPP